MFRHTIMWLCRTLHRVSHHHKQIIDQAANVKGFHASMNPRLEGGIPDFLEKFNTR